MKATGKKPYFTVKTLAGLLSGDNQCHASAWIKSRFWYAKEPSTFDFAKWTMDHKALVERRILELAKPGVTVENQNKFTLEGQQAVLVGKQDIVAWLDAETVLVSDAKTGNQRLTDWWQVLIYMTCLPLAKPAFRGKTIRGEIVYTNGVIEIPQTDLTEERKAAIWAKIRELARAQAFPTTPSAQECAFCDIGDCTDRIAAEAATAVTEF